MYGFFPILYFYIHAFPDFHLLSISRINCEINVFLNIYDIVAFANLFFYYCQAVLIRCALLGEYLINSCFSKRINRTKFLFLVVQNFIYSAIEFCVHFLFVLFGHSFLIIKLNNRQISEL